MRRLWASTPKEFDADTGRHLGNFPQAFSHLALIEAAERLILAEQIDVAEQYYEISS